MINIKGLSEKEMSIRRKKLISMIDEIEKKNYDPTTTALAQLIAIREVWSDVDIDWVKVIDKIKKNK